MEGAEIPRCPATAPKPERSGEDLYGGVGQNPCCSVCKPSQELQETSDLCNCKQRFLYQILSSIFLLYQILIWCNKMEINYLKIIQCDFLDFFLDSVSHSWGVPTMKMTDLSILCKWETLKKSAVYQILIWPTVYTLYNLFAHPCLYYYLLSPQYTVLHILFYCTFYSSLFYLYLCIFSCIVLHILHCPLSGPDLHFTTDYILYNWVCDE